MASPPPTPAQRMLGFALSVAAAAALVGLATCVRMALTPRLGPQSPFMIYVAAVLIAGLIRGAWCGVMVMLVSGYVGLHFFLAPQGRLVASAPTELGVFWAVAALVLTTANALRVHLEETMHRITAALRRLA